MDLCYPLLVVTDLPLRYVLKNAFALGLMCAKHAAAAVLICCFVLYYALLCFPLSIPFLIFGVLSLLGLLCTVAAWAGIREHVVAEALSKSKKSYLEDADEGGGNLEFVNTRDGWSAMLYDAKSGEYCFSKKYELRIIDRVGGGDGFGGGLIYALLTGKGTQGGGGVRGRGLRAQAHHRGRLQYGHRR